MVVRTCQKCNKNFERKSTYDAHMKKKYDCQTGILKPEDVHECKFCLKKIARKDNHALHEKRCKKKNNDDVIEELKQEIEILKKEIQPVNNQTIINENGGNVIINNIQNINNIHIQNNIQYNDYGTEDLSKINLHEILEKNADVIPKFLYELHCSLDRPENHNVGIKDVKRYQAFIKKNGEWIETNKNKILNELLNKITDHIGEKHLEDCNKIGFKETDILYKNALREIKYVDPAEALFEKQKRKETLESLEYVLHTNKDRIFSDKNPSIKKRANYKSSKRIELQKENNVLT
jgi:hypothetical protein